MTLSGVGRFPPTGSASVLWVGIEANQALTQLHQAVGSAMGQVGFQPESRAYTPHLTLARCERWLCGDVVAEFLECHRELSLGPVHVREFVLYSSTLGASGPVYRAERRFPL
jgi:2'-5' RNA ligase